MGEIVICVFLLTAVVLLAKELISARGFRNLSYTDIWRRNTKMPPLLLPKIGGNKREIKVTPADLEVIGSFWNKKIPDVAIKGAQFTAVVRSLRSGFVYLETPSGSFRRARVIKKSRSGKTVEVGLSSHNNPDHVRKRRRRPVEFVIYN